MYSEEMKPDGIISGIHLFVLLYEIYVPSISLFKYVIMKTTYTPFAKPLYVMLKPVGLCVIWRVTIAIIWKKPICTKTLQNM